MSGIREIDDLLVDIFKKIKINKYKNLKIKFHPILESSQFKENFKNEIKGDGSNIINLSKIIVTTSYTSGLYESLARNSFTLMINTNPLDEILFRDLKRESNRIVLINNIDKLEENLRNFSNKKIKFIDNKQIKHSFFNK